MRLPWALTIGCLSAFGMQGQVVLDRLEVVASGVSTGNGGNGWGAHKLRIVRTNAGVFTAYSVGSYPYCKFRLAQSSASGWKTVLEEAGAPTEPVNLLARRDGSLIVVARPPGGVPVVLSSKREAEGFAVLKFRPPSSWDNCYHDQTLYHGATISAADDLDILTSYEQKAGGLHLARWNAVKGKWSFRDIETEFRHCYSFLFPGADGPEWLAVRDVRWERAGLKIPPGAFPYVFNELRFWRWTGPKKGTLLREETQTEEYLNPTCFPQDVYRDQRGRLHILYGLKGKSTGGQGTSRHMVLREDRTQEEDVALPRAGMDAWRMIQDTSGAFYFIAPGHGDSLMVYGPSEDALDLGVPKVLDLKGNRVSQQIFLATPRAGVPVGDVVDGAFLSTDAKWVYFRLRLRS